VTILKAPSAGRTALMSFFHEWWLRALSSSATSNVTVLRTCRLRFTRIASADDSVRAEPDSLPDGSPVSLRGMDRDAPCVLPDGSLVPLPQMTRCEAGPPTCPMADSHRLGESVISGPSCLDPHYSDTSRYYQPKTGHSRTGQYLHWAKVRPDAQCWW